MLRKVPAALVVAALLIAIPGVIDLTRGGHDEPAAAALTPGSAAAGTLDADARVAFWRQRIVHDADYLNRIRLAEALLEVARQTGELPAYAEAGEVIDEALTANPRSLDALAVRAAVLFGTHDFADAATTAQSVLDEDPGSLAALAVNGDALLELGRYAEAGAAYDLLFAREQGPAVLVRQARLAWHRGDTTGAVTRAEQALRRANEARLPAPDVAFYALQLATYLFDTGDVEAAGRLAADAARIAPELPAAQATLGRIVAGAGDIDAAIGHYEAAVAAVPRPEYLAALGDLHQLRGDTARAEEQFTAVELIAQLGRSEQDVYSRELARFFVDHDRRLPESLAAARRGAETRRDVYGLDTLAWALFRNGHIGEAAGVAAEPALLKSKDPVVLYHLGRIALAAGDPDTARSRLGEALATNPGFDPIQAPIATELLAELENEGVES